MRTSIIILLLSCLLQSCSKDNNNSSPDTFESLYGGRPFKGAANAILERDGLEQLTWNGNGLVSLIESSGDSLSIVFLSDFGNKSEINFKLRGKVERNYFTLNGNSSPPFFNIIDERITGNIAHDIQDICFEGIMHRGRAKLTAQIYFKKASDPFPKGSTLHLTLDTRREIEEDDDDETGCQMRLVPIWSPSGMTMGMVPDC